MDKLLKSAAAWFEIPCADLDRAQRFYETILGCRMQKDDFGDSGDVMCVFPAERGGVAGALVKRPLQQPSSTGTIFYLTGNGRLDGPTARALGAGGPSLMNRPPVQGGFGASPASRTPR